MPAKEFETIAILGTGLIGSSLARAIKAQGLSDNLIVYDANADVRKISEELGFADAVASSPQDAVKSADLVILAVPPAQIVPVFNAIKEDLKPGTLVTDVGSTKQNIMDGIVSELPPGVVFIGGHPIAGTEDSGPRAGFASLFEKRWCILTPGDAPKSALTQLENFWQALGSDVVVMEADRHDMVLATTSHLPHLIAFALVGTAMDMETVTRNEVVKYSAGGFRDFTRIAASDPQMWRDVFLENRESVLEVLGRYIEDLTALKRAIRWGDGETLLNQFTKTGDIRRRIVDAGQDSNKPDFGRAKP